MSNSKEKIAETLRRAIKGEEEGYYFYDLVSKKVTHPDAKIKLEGLRDDEINHKKVLVENSCKLIIFSFFIKSEIIIIFFN